LMADKGGVVRRALSSLSDDTRYRLVKYLLEHGPTTAGELAERLSKARSTVSEHLEELLEAGLVAKRKSDRRYLYEATQLAKACLDFMEGRAAEDEVLASLPEKAGLEVKVKEGRWLRALAEGWIKLFTLSLGVGLGVVHYALFRLELMAVAVAVGFLLGLLGSVRGVRVSRVDVAAFCVALSITLALAAAATIEEFSPAVIFIAGLLWYLLVFGLCSLIPFEAAKFLVRYWRGRA